MVSHDVIIACALVKASIWENLGASLIKEGDLQYIREHVHHNHARMVRVLTSWNRTHSPKVGQLLQWFEHFDISKRAIKQKYEEHFRGK